MFLYQGRSRPGLSHPHESWVPRAGSGTVGLTLTQWASKKQFVDRFGVLILLKINCGNSEKYFGGHGSDPKPTGELTTLHQTSDVVWDRRS